MNRAVLFAFFAFGLAQPVYAAYYKIDANHTQVLFTYNHFGYSNITGRFNGVTGTFDFDPAKPTDAKITVQLPIASLSTGVPRLDEHMRSDDFFDAEKFPTASFTSEKIEVVDATHLTVSGTLTIHGVSQATTLSVSINQLGEHPFSKAPAVGFDATTTLKRSAFGIGGMVPLVGDDVTLRITMEAQASK